MPTVNEIFQKRFNELAKQYDEISFRQTKMSTSRLLARGEDWRQWAVSALNLVQAVFGKEGAHSNYFVEVLEKCRGYNNEVSSLKGIFMSAKQDFEGGYVFDVDLRVSGEIFGDFIVMSREALRSGNKNVAAVLACAALEDTLKKFAATNGLIVDNKSMQEIVSALKSKGLVSGAQKTLLDTMPKIRDYAMHANWDKINDPDVNSVIGFVEQFLLSNFSQ